MGIKALLFRSKFVSLVKLYWHVLFSAECTEWFDVGLQCSKMFGDCML